MSPLQGIADELAEAERRCAKKRHYPFGTPSLRQVNAIGSALAPGIGLLPFGDGDPDLKSNPHSCPRQLPAVGPVETPPAWLPPPRCQCPAVA